MDECIFEFSSYIINDQLAHMFHNCTTLNSLWYCNKQLLALLHANQLKSTSERGNLRCIFSARINVLQKRNKEKRWESCREEKDEERSYCWVYSSISINITWGIIQYHWNIIEGKVLHNKMRFYNTLCSDF